MTEAESDCRCRTDSSHWVAFVLLNNLAGHVGMLRDWTPWVVAAAPSLLFLLLSMAAFTWLVRYR